MWLLTLMIWTGSGDLTAFTKELPSEVLCHQVGASYHMMADFRSTVQYQCIKLDISRSKR
jgi:hypothetical protein